MKAEIIYSLTIDFEQAAHQHDGVEYWYARELQTLLGYAKWENFFKVIEKAHIACSNAGQNIADHFPEVRKMVELGSGSQREIEDIALTRYACYLIAQNGDPRKDQIAFAMSYFAVQTRKQELLEARIQAVERLQAREKLSLSEKELSGIIYEKGADEQGFARIRSKGDKVLFGGYSTKDMKKKLNVPDSRPLADFLPTITIKAKDFANEITNFNIKKDDVRGESAITSEHEASNSTVRKALLERGIKPENLPPDEDIKKVQRRLQSEEKKALKGTKKIKRPNEKP
jgi:DNA-damage-inducible protein D